VNVVESPHELNGQYLYRAVQRPAIQDSMQIGGGGEIFELTVAESAPIAGLSLIDADSEELLPQETVVVAIVRDDELHIPRGESDLKTGDTVTIFAKDGASDRITDAFTRD
jgi:trk system potassium uptake protein TrkA